MTRFVVAATGVTGPADVRDRMQRAQDGKLSASEAVPLAIELDALAALLASGRG